MMLTESFRDPFAHAFADLDDFEVKSLAAAFRPRRTTADRVRAALVGLAGGKRKLLSHDETAWASITFSGTRHCVVMEFCGVDAVACGEDLIECLPNHEFAIPGQLVADATIAMVDHRFGAMERLEVTCVLLLLEDG